MSVTVKEKADKYYPKLWSVNRLKNLVEVGALTEAEYNEITGFVYPATE